MKQETKRKLLIVLWWSLGLVFLAAMSFIFLHYQNLPLYHNKQFHFSLRYPKKWWKLENLTQNTPIVFTRPKETALDLFEPSVNISIYEVPDRIASLEGFSKTILTQMMAVKKDMVITESKDCEFANRHGHRMVLDAPVPDNMRVLFVWAVKGPFAYIFTFIARDQQYKELTPTINEMVSSFEFK